jgi:hypothetical protein
MGITGTQSAPLRSRDYFCLVSAGMAGGGHGGRGYSPVAAVDSRSRGGCFGAIGWWSRWGWSGPFVICCSAPLGGEYV